MKQMVKNCSSVMGKAKVFITRLLFPVVHWLVGSANWLSSRWAEKSHVVLEKTLGESKMGVSEVGS